MDKLFIRQLRVPVLIGVNPAERLAPQIISIDLDCAIDITQAAVTDNIADTLDYAKLSQALTEYLSTTQFELLESLIDRTAKKLLADFPIRWLQLSIAKQPADMPDVSCVGMTIERGELA